MILTDRYKVTDHIQKEYRLADTYNSPSRQKEQKEKGVDDHFKNLGKSFPD